MARILRMVLLYAPLALLLAAAAALAWLRWDAAQPLADYFAARKGAIAAVRAQDATSADGQVSQFLTLVSDSTLEVSFRVIRKGGANSPLPVLLVLGGHRTGSDAADLFGDVGDRAVIALDYPYHGPSRTSGLIETLGTIPRARQAFADTPPAISLVVDWIVEQPWADKTQIVIVGASLGVPFAALAAARDARIDGALLVHGAADNEAWLETQIARRSDIEALHGPLATIVHLLAYGPTFDTARNVALIAPRPVVIIGARNDERTPVAQTNALYAAAREPKLLLWTQGRHVDPDRSDVIAELLAIADEVVPFLRRR